MEKEVLNIIKKVGMFDFACLVSTPLRLVAELDIVLMRHDEPGKIISSGDIDNRLKTLFDALRAPKDVNEIPDQESPTRGEMPFYCLLEDDSLITSVKVTCDRLLRYRNRSHVFLLIHVKTKQTGAAGTRWIDLCVP